MMLNEINQRKASTVGPHLYVYLEKVKFMETEVRMVVARTWREREMRRC